MKFRTVPEVFRWQLTVVESIESNSARENYEDSVRIVIVGIHGSWSMEKSGHFLRQ